MRGEAVMKEATSIKALISSLWWCGTCVVTSGMTVCGDEWCDGVGCEEWEVCRVWRCEGCECLP